MLRCPITINAILSTKINKYAILTIHFIASPPLTLQPAEAHALRQFFLYHNI